MRARVTLVLSFAIGVLALGVITVSVQAATPPLPPPPPIPPPPAGKQTTCTTTGPAWVAWGIHTPNAPASRQHLSGQGLGYPLQQGEGAPEGAHAQDPAEPEPEHHRSRGVQVQEQGRRVVEAPPLRGQLHTTQARGPVQLGAVRRQGRLSSTLGGESVSPPRACGSQSLTLRRSVARAGVPNVPGRRA